MYDDGFCKAHNSEIYFYRYNNQVFANLFYVLNKITLCFNLFSRLTNVFVSKMLS